MIFLQMGDSQKGQWIEESVDILSDYRRAFGEDPPATASLAIMNDSDDTGQSSVSYVEFIEVYR
jgi:Ca2+-binding EF-hand superfamily protein